MKSISFFTLVFTFLLILFSCKKDSNSGLTKKEMLTSHGWKYSSQEGFGLYSSSLLPPEYCSLDNCYFYRKDGTFLNQVGSIKCDPNEQDHITSYVLADDGHIVEGGSSDTYTSIFSIDTNKLVLKWEYNGWGVYTTFVPC